VVEVAIFEPGSDGDGTLTAERAGELGQDR
jgi:hypothetical protein